ncbi:MAG: hypothetical protein KAY37_10175 [Phycisphaerae bacterium]|nr:hypothetical protein [Phycisphaerae bacterium]
MTNLPHELRDLTQRQERLRKALQAAQKADAKGQQKKGPAQKRSAKVPVAELQGPFQNEADQFVNGDRLPGRSAIRRHIPLFSKGYGDSAR